MRLKYEAAEEARKWEAEKRHEEVMAERRRVMEVLDLSTSRKEKNSLSSGGVGKRRM